MALLFVFRISYFLFLILPYFIPPVLLQRLPCRVRRPVSYTHLIPNLSGGAREADFPKGVNRFWLVAFWEEKAVIE